jgi:uncharacterized membrane protein YkvA (DUF1232 family)
MDVTMGLAVVFGLIALWAALVAVLWLLRPRDVRLRDVVDVVPDVVRLMRSIVAETSTPLDVRLVLIGLIAWILSPVDLIPEFLPVIGPLDDVLVAALALRYVRHRLGRAELRARWSGNDAGFALLTRVMG